MKEHEIEGVDKFEYLGATITSEGVGMVYLKKIAELEIQNWARSGVVIKSKGKQKNRLHKTPITPVLLYGCDIWKMNKGDNKIIDSFQNKCLRKILKTRWEDHISTEELNRRLEMRLISQEI